MTISDEQIPSALSTSSSEPSPDTELPPNTSALATTSAPEEVDFNTLNKIRDLLFGQQVQSQEEKIDQLENRLNQECADIRDQINQRLQALATSIRNDLQTLTQTVQANHTSQTAELERQRTSILATLNEKVASLETDFDHQHAELKALLEREVQSLQSVDAQDRDQLADLFSQLAVNIRSNS